jgi:hypothetical protein
MKKIKMMVASISVLLLVGCACATTEYKAFEGKLDGIIEGKGGAKFVVDNMEIWDDGEPPRKFKILGFIDDNRVAGRISMRFLRGSLVEKARKAGGDAVIKMNTQAQLGEYYAAGGAAIKVYSSAIHSTYGSLDRNISKYAVVKYLK